MAGHLESYPRRTMAGSDRASTRFLCHILLYLSVQVVWGLGRMRRCASPLIVASIQALARFVSSPYCCRARSAASAAAYRASSSTTTWVEFHHTLDDEDGFHRLISGIRGVPPGPSPSAAIYASAPPYRGLQVFDVGDWPFFFGREALVEWLIDALSPPDNLRPANRASSV